ncbi:hypothetical protein ES703_76023 [subsurface metagenome]
MKHLLSSWASFVALVIIILCLVPRIPFLKRHVYGEKIIM